MIYVTWFLVGMVVVLLWRLWRLENRVDSGELHNMTAYVARSEMNWAMYEERKFGNSVADRLNALARALGYEWKRTDAKEGWEKKRVEGAPFFGCAVSTPLRPSSWVWRDEPPADRRKADRRKPAPQAAPKSPPKRPRRAH